MTATVPRMFQDRFTLPPGASELILVRHGTPRPEIPGDPFPLLDGRHADPPLSETGEAQARAVAQRLAHEPITGLYVTSLCRTGETSAPLAELTGLVPTELHDLRETSLGQWESGEFDRRAAMEDPLVAEIFAAERWDVIPGAEAQEFFRERVDRGLRALTDGLSPDSAVVAFLHQGVIAEICSLITHSRRFAFLFTENASVTRFVKLADGTWRLRTFNDVCHLDGQF